MKKYAIIVAGGKGLRMGGDLPKQFRVIAGRPVLMQTIDAFYRNDPETVIILVLPEHHQKYWQDLCREYSFGIKHQVAAGGETRFHSVKSGLTLITEPGYIAVHDGVRPLVSREVLSNAYAEAIRSKAVIPVIEVTDSLREIQPDGESKAVARSCFRAVQTPQVFDSEVLLKAYDQPYNKDFTDDASVVEATGQHIHLITGNIENIKITTPQDLTLAEMLISHV